MGVSRERETSSGGSLNQAFPIGSRPLTSCAT
jgi:hypothetical protein